MFFIVWFMYEKWKIQSMMASNDFRSLPENKVVYSSYCDQPSSLTYQFFIMASLLRTLILRFQRDQWLENLILVIIDNKSKLYLCWSRSIPKIGSRSTFWSSFCENYDPIFYDGESKHKGRRFIKCQSKDTNIL